MASLPRGFDFFTRGRGSVRECHDLKKPAQPAGEATPSPRPAIEQQVLELVRLGLKVHDISGLLGVHPRATNKKNGAHPRRLACPIRFCVPV
jgi:hypothetical protein